MSKSRISKTNPLSIEGVNALSKFFYWANESTFEDCFGIQMGRHLWDKFVNESHRDGILLWGALDGNNTKLLVDYINQGINATEFLRAKDARIREAARA